MDEKERILDLACRFVEVVESIDFSKRGHTVKEAFEILGQVLLLKEQIKSEARSLRELGVKP